MRIYLTVIILIFTINLFGQNSEQKTIELSEIKLCELTLSELIEQDENLKEIEIIEMDLCSDGFVQDARFENRKGYISKFYIGIVFQKDRDTDLISKIRLTKEFKGNLPDGTYIDLSSLTANKTLVKYPDFNTWTSRGCSDYWSLTNKKMYFYVAIDKNKEPRYPIDENYYLTKPIEGIDIVANCYEYIKEKEIQNDPLFIIDGKEVSKSELQKYEPENIETVTVIKEIGIEKYGEKGKNGVIIIETKSYYNYIKKLIGKWLLVKKTNNLPSDIGKLEEENSDLEIEPGKINEEKEKTTLTFNDDKTIFINQKGDEYNSTYKLNDSLLTMGNRKYIIIEIDKEKLIYKEKEGLFDTHFEYKKVE